MNVFIIGATHQIMQVEVAIKYYKLELSETILIYMDTSEDRNVDSLLLPLGITYKIFKNWVFKDLIKHNYHKLFITYIKELLSECKTFSLFSSYYSSDYALIANAILKPKMFVLMDEGTASIQTVNQRTYSKIELRHIIKSFFYHRIIKFPPIIHFFSQYDLCVKKPDVLDLYTFNKKENILNMDDKYAIILGSTLSEMKIVSWDSYANALNNISKQLSEKNVNRVDYYSHRKESEEKRKLVKSLGWNFVENEIPFEQLFPKLDPCPFVIYSFISPVLDNIAKKYYNLPQFYIIHFNDKAIINGRAVLYKTIISIYSKNPQLDIILL